MQLSSKCSGRICSNYKWLLKARRTWPDWTRNINQIYNYRNSTHTDTRPSIYRTDCKIRNDKDEIFAIALSAAVR